MHIDILRGTERCDMRYVNVVREVETAWILDWGFVAAVLGILIFIAVVAAAVKITRLVRVNHIITVVNDLVSAITLEPDDALTANRVANRIRSDLSTLHVITGGVSSYGLKWANAAYGSDSVTDTVAAVDIVNNAISLSDWNAHDPNSTLVMFLGANRDGVVHLMSDDDFTTEQSSDEVERLIEFRDVLLNELTWFTQSVMKSEGNLGRLHTVVESATILDGLRSNS